MMNCDDYKAKQTFKLFPNLCLLNHNKYYISFYKKLSANKNKESLPYKYISNTDINLSLNNSIKISINKKGNKIYAYDMKQRKYLNILKKRKN